jgi:hypothetical protein
MVRFDWSLIWTEELVNLKWKFNYKERKKFKFYENKLLASEKQCKFFRFLLNYEETET